MTHPLSEDYDWSDAEKTVLKPLVFGYRPGAELPPLTFRLLDQVRARDEIVLRSMGFLPIGYSASNYE